MLPIQEVLLWSLLLSLILAILYRVLTKPAEIRRLKDELKEHRVRMKEVQKSGDKAATDKALSEMMALNQKQLKGNMKPMLASMIIFFVAVGFLRDAYSNFLIQLPFTLPLFSYSWPFIILRDTIGWFWWYILITIPATFAFRKLLGVE